MKDDYITVKQASEILGVSPQSIYKRLKVLNNQNNQIVNEVEKVESGRKLVNINILADLMGIKIKQVESPVEEVKQPLNEVEQPVESDLIEVLKAEIEHLRDENKELIRLLDQQQHLTMAAEKRAALLEQKSEPEFPEDAHQTAEPEENKKRGFIGRFFNR